MSKRRIAMLVGLVMLWMNGVMAATKMDQRGVLLGKWKFVGYIFEDQFQDPPNPNLVLTFEFFKDGTDLLHWHRLDEDGFCERKGRFTYDGVNLRDEVIWVNPENSFECFRDPDMTMGRKQVTPVHYNDDHLMMELPLSDHTLTYVWERVVELQGPRPSGLRRSLRP
jgi:hypothetical protein